MFYGPPKLILCPCKHEPCVCCSNGVTPVAVDLCLGLRTLIGHSLVAVLAKTKDGQHVPPLLPPQRVSFVQRGELAAKRRGVRVSVDTHTNTQIHRHLSLSIIARTYLTPDSLTLTLTLKATTFHRATVDLLKFIFCSFIKLHFLKLIKSIFCHQTAKL